MACVHYVSVGVCSLCMMNVCEYNCVFVCVSFSYIDDVIMVLMIAQRHKYVIAGKHIVCHSYGCKLQAGMQPASLVQFHSLRYEHKEGLHVNLT